MKKLFTVKKIHTFESAAMLLSEHLKEKVSISDIYEFVLDGDITASIRFREAAYGVRINQDLGVGVTLRSSEDESPEIVVEKVHVLSGIYDLPLIGLEKYRVHEKFVSKTEQLDLVPESLKFYVTKGDESYALLKALPLSTDEAHKHAAEIFLNNFLLSKGMSSDEFFNSGYRELFEQLSTEEIELVTILCNLPELGDEELVTLEEPHLDLVIRTDELMQFVGSLVTERPRKFIDPRMLTTAHVMNAAYLHELGWKLHDKKTVSRTKRSTENIGAPLSDDSIRSHIKLIEEAIERKQKIV
ncbi:hypothetical protein [Vibrio rotiferianus]|uniref:hypothetical protein n=1 Tax=Vibrio rotiferianus TaxID=190895 RepID=UPI00148E77A4|nr:hypothetical protein [Vibrio rotiferianus]NOH69063.1 hypothetical protein [Vibrio rotiferianus]